MNHSAYNVLEGADIYPVILPKEDTDFLFRITGVLREMLNVHLTIDEVMSKILNSYKEENTYISLFSLSKRVRFSLSEVTRLSTFSDREKRTLDYMLNAHLRNRRITTLTDLVKKELKITEGKLNEFEGESWTINEVWSEIEKDYMAKFSRQQMRKGIKKLIIKSVIVANVTRDN